MFSDVYDKLSQILRILTEIQAQLPPSP